MEENVWREYAFQVSIKRTRDTGAVAEIRIRMRDGEWFCVARQSWPAGAPTPQQLELLQATVADELQTHVLAVCGVQGVLLAEEGPAL